MARTISDLQRKLCLDLEIFIVEVKSEEKKIQVRRWKEEVQNIFRARIGLEAANVIDCRRVELQKKTDAVTRTRNVIQKHYDITLGAQSCRIYFREREWLGENKGQLATAATTTATVTKKSVWGSSGESFIHSIKDENRRRNYMKVVSELGRRYFYVWGLQRGQASNPPDKEKRNHDRINDQLSMSSPFQDIPFHNPVQEESRAIAMVDCAYVALNEIMHGSFLGSEVCCPGSYDFGPLDGAQTLTTDDLYFVHQLAIYKNLFQVPGPDITKRRWNNSCNLFHYEENELAAEKRIYLGYAKLQPAQENVVPLVLNEFLTLTSLAMAPTDHLLYEFRQITSWCTTFGGIDDCFHLVIDGLGGQELEKCQEFQQRVIHNLEHLSGLRLYNLCVHSWHLQYLLYIRMFRATELIRAMVAARTVVEKVPDAVMIGFMAFLKARPTPHPVYKGISRGSLNRTAENIYNRLSQALDGIDACGKVYRDVFGAYDKFDPQQPIRRVVDQLVIDGKGALVTNVPADPYNGILLTYYTFGNLVRLFEARAITITMYQPRPHFAVAPKLNPNVLESETNDRSVSFLSPVTEVLHYMIKCAEDDEFVGRQIKWGTTICRNPEPGTAKFHNYASRTFIHRQLDGHSRNIRCRLHPDNTGPIVTTDQKAYWGFLMQAFPAVHYADHIRQLMTRGENFPEQLRIAERDCDPPFVLPDWMLAFFLS